MERLPKIFYQLKKKIDTYQTQQKMIRLKERAKDIQLNGETYRARLLKAPNFPHQNNCPKTTGISSYYSYGDTLSGWGGSPGGDVYYCLDCSGKRGFLD